MWRWNRARTWSASCFFAQPAPSRAGGRARVGRRVKGRAGKVALTVDASDEAFGEIIDALRPDMLQLHGEETPERVTYVARKFGLPMIKALPIEKKTDFERLKDYAFGPDMAARRSTDADIIGFCSTRGLRLTLRDREDSVGHLTGR